MALLWSYKRPLIQQNPLVILFQLINLQNLCVMPFPRTNWKLTYDQILRQLKRFDQIKTNYALVKMLHISHILLLPTIEWRKNCYFRPFRSNSDVYEKLNLLAKYEGMTPFNFSLKRKKSQMHFRGWFNFGVVMEIFGKKLFDLCYETNTIVFNDWNTITIEAAQNTAKWWCYIVWNRYCSKFCSLAWPCAKKAKADRIFGTYKGHYAVIHHSTGDIEWILLLKRTLNRLTFARWGRQENDIGEKTVCTIKLTTLIKTWHLISNRLLLVLPPSDFCFSGKIYTLSGGEHTKTRNQKIHDGWKLFNTF